MKAMTVTLTAMELALAVLVLVFVFGHTDSPSLARAWSEYHSNPTVETKTKFNDVKTLVERRELLLTVGAGLLLALNSYFLFKTIRSGTVKSQPKAA